MNEIREAVMEWGCFRWSQALLIRHRKLLLIVRPCSQRTQHYLFSLSYHCPIQPNSHPATPHDGLGDESHSWVIFVLKKYFIILHFPLAFALINVSGWFASSQQCHATMPHNIRWYDGKGLVMNGLVRDAVLNHQQRRNKKLIFMGFIYDKNNFLWDIKMWLIG